MIFLKRPIKAILLAVVCCVIFASCDTKERREICDYNVQLSYNYNKENTSTMNMIEYYVYTIDEYIFDEQGILYAINHIVSDPCGNGTKSEIDLPAGRYSVIAIGNKGELSHVGDAGDVMSDPKVNVTYRKDMTMILKNAKIFPEGTSDHNERLYYAYRTFSVDKGHTSRVRVDMVHQHFRLDFRVRWQTNPPTNTEDFYVTMDGVPTDYTLMPEFAYINGICADYNATQHDTYERVTTDPRQFISTVKLPADASVTWDYRVSARMNGGRQLSGEFITYRHRNETHAMFGIYQGTPGSGTLLHNNPIDISAYFTHPNVGIDLDKTLKQEYRIEFLINNNGTITISMLDIANWDEGGQIL